MPGHYQTPSVCFVAFPEYLCLPLACPPDAFRQLMRSVYPLASRRREHLGLQAERAPCIVLPDFKDGKHCNQPFGMWAWGTAARTALGVETPLERMPVRLSSACLSAS